MKNRFLPYDIKYGKKRFFLIFKFQLFFNPSVFANNLCSVVHDDLGKWASLNLTIIQYVIKSSIPANELIIKVTEPAIFPVYNDNSNNC